MNHCKVANDDPTKVALDAARYRWLREQHWNESMLCVVANPRQAVKLGYDCPSLKRLDDIVDAGLLECQRAVPSTS